MNINLPVFPGFYNTVFELDYDSNISNDMAYFFSKENCPELYDYMFEFFNREDVININSNEYEVDVAKSAIEYVNDTFCFNLMNEFGTPFELVYEYIDSPKYYNFRNDRIVCSIKTDDFDRFQKELKDYITIEQNRLSKFIKEHFTSCDGFVSFYSNNIEDWLNKEEFDSVEVEYILLFIMLSYKGYQLLSEGMMVSVQRSIEQLEYVEFKDSFIRMSESEQFRKIIKEYTFAINQVSEYEKQKGYLPANYKETYEKEKIKFVNELIELHKQFK